VALLVTKWALAMSKDEEISGPGARDSGLAQQVNGEYKRVMPAASARMPGRLGVMNNSPTDRRSPWGPFGEPAPRPYDRVVEVLRTRHWRFLAMPTGKGFMQVSINRS
jgi:hypothetical protein